MSKKMTTVFNVNISTSSGGLYIIGYDPEFNDHHSKGDIVRCGKVHYRILKQIGITSIYILELASQEDYFLLQREIEEEIKFKKLKPINQQIFISEWAPLDIIKETWVK